MILLDTHIWVWWIHRDGRLSKKHVQWIQEHEADGLGVSAGGGPGGERGRQASEVGAERAAGPPAARVLHDRGGGAIAEGFAAKRGAPPGEGASAGRPDWPRMADARRGSARSSRSA